jgi:hypothetical protein
MLEDVCKRGINKKGKVYHNFYFYFLEDKSVEYDFLPRNS